MATDPSRHSAGPSAVRAHALRLRPGDDLRRGIENYAAERHIKAGAILTCVGSLSEAKLRPANAEQHASYRGPFEIVSLVGTISPGGVHLHISLSDAEGHTIGGHVVQGCAIHTTAEIVIAELDGMEFSREPDAATGYSELFITPRGGQTD